MVSSKTTILTIKGSTSILIKITTLDLGNTMRLMDMGSLGIFKEFYMLENGFMTNRTVLEKNIGLMGQYFEVSSKRATKKRANFLGLTTVTMREISLMTSLMGKGFSFGRIVVLIRGVGKLTRCMA